MKKRKEKHRKLYKNLIIIYTVLFVTCLPELEIPEFLSDEESEHIISLAKDSGLTMSIAGFDMAAYEGDLDEDLAEAGKKLLLF